LFALILTFAVVVIGPLRAVLSTVALKRWKLLAALLLLASTR
jgi:hypothetical protein